MDWPRTIRVMYASVSILSICIIKLQVIVTQIRCTMVSQILQNSTTCTFILNNLYLYSAKYIFIQQFTVIFNILYLCSTIRILFSYSTKLFSFNNNIYSTSIAIFILLNKINCSTSVQTFYSTTIIIQLLPCIFYEEVFESSRTFEISLFNKFPVPSPVKYAV